MESNFRSFGAALGGFVALGALCAGLLPVRAENDSNRRACEEAPCAVYTMSNAAAGNAVLIFRRAPNGKLTPDGSIPTGGRGTGTGLGNQGGVVLSEDQRWLLAVDAGSDDIAVFALLEDGLVRVAKAPSGGRRPVSVTVDDDLVYVVNAGSDNLTGFRLDSGQLQPLAGSTRPLSGTGTSPAEIKFSPDGHSLVVTEKATNKLTIYSVGRDGLPGTTPTIVSSAGKTPFGFDFARHRTLIASEAASGAANASSVSSYRLSRDSVLTLVDAAVPTKQTAACWIAITPDGRFAYASDTGSAAITGFGLAPGGVLIPLSQDGKTGAIANNGAPIDMAITADGRFLFALDSKNHTISAFGIGSDGSLAPGSVLSGLPAAANGLAAR